MSSFKYFSTYERTQQYKRKKETYRKTICDIRPNKLANCRNCQCNEKWGKNDVKYLMNENDTADNRLFVMNSQ